MCVKYVKNYYVIISLKKNLNHVKSHYKSTSNLQDWLNKMLHEIREGLRGEEED